MAAQPKLDRAAALEARSIIQRELDYRRARRWQIFIWASTILVAVAAGAVALQLQAGVTLSVAHKALFSIAVAVLAAYAGLWWEKQRQIGRSLHRELKRLDRDLNIAMRHKRGDVLDRVGGLYTIFLLALVAIAAIWLPAR